MRKKLLASGFASFLLISVISCADNADKDTTMTNSDTTTTVTTETMDMNNAEQGVMVGGANMVPSKNIVENAANSQDHTTLVTAVQAADLAGTLSGAGPFTVFAPTNTAFEKLPAGTVDNLLKAENKEQLQSVLTYHVVPGKYMASDLKDGQTLKTVQGSDLKVTVKDGTVMVDGATVTIPNVVSSNGVTHVIDAVIMPKK